MAESTAIRGAQWVVSKALSPLSDGLVEAWAASSALAPNIEAVKMELLYAQAMLDNARGREIHNPALTELLQKLRRLAYDADDVLDELDYFRIQDELEGTFETIDRGCFHDLIRDARHTTKAAAKHLECSSCFSPSSKPEQGGTRSQRTSCASSTVHAVGKRLSSLLPFPDDRKTPKLDFDRVDVSRRMRRIVEQLQPICAKVSIILDLELSSSRYGITSGITTSRSTTTSESIEPKLYGRDPEKNTIIESITKGVHCHQDLTVLPIVGPGGIGKTTLTQYIYNSKEVQDHFQVRIWACVSLDFNVRKLTQEILSSIPKAKDELDGSPLQSLDQLQKLVEKRLKQKRFLVVLDDVWKCGEEEWKSLLIPFTKCQVNGNIILVTTRFLDVAEKVKTINCKVTQLDRLNPTEFWSFFMACVFGHGESKQMPKGSELSYIGHQIVEKLKGSPLAAKTVGRLLRNNPTPDYWTRVLQSKEWDLQISDYDIMPALKLSYDYLPFHLQQCFSYCALFPEDYKFNSEELIRFWIGLDILRPDHPSKTIEDIGTNYLNDLVNYGFFKKEIGGHNSYYAMHDLLHDLALKVSSQECLHIDSSSATPIEIPPSIYHLSISLSPANSEDRTAEGSFKKELAKIGSRLKSENLHTLMTFGQYDHSFIVTLSDLFKDVKSLRLVHLSRMRHPVESILYNFSKLVHLRYIKLGAYYGYELHLPISLSRFYHLRVLDIQEWQGAQRLPKDMSNLSKLRHFLVPRDAFELHSNISNVGKLCCLQELLMFEVKKHSNGFELRELGELVELRGSLSIRNLEEVQVNEAYKAKLPYKKRLQQLSLNWKDNKNSEIQNQILEILRPHNNLSELEIQRGGSTCPTWLGTGLLIKGLEALHLDSVNWKMFPPLGELWLIDGSNGEYFGCVTGQHFRNLKRLELIRLPNLKKWEAKEVCPMFFLVMEVLIIKDCSELIELPFSYYNLQTSEDVKATWFPKLREARIIECPKLVSLPPIPYTHTLSVVEINHVGTGLKKLSYGSTRYTLEIVGNMDLNGLDDKILAFHNLSQLQSLEITGCQLLAGSYLQMLTSLKKLKLISSNVVFNSLESKGDDEWQLLVEYLNVESWHAGGKTLSRLLARLPKLSQLSILDCPKITRLRVAVEQQQTITVDPEDTQANEPTQQQLPVEYLHIRLWDASYKALTQLLSCLSKLLELHIWNCQRKTRICVAVEQQPTTFLELVDTQANEPNQRQQQVAEKDLVEEEKVAVPQPALDQEDEDSMLLLPAHLSNSLWELYISDCPELILDVGRPPLSTSSHKEETIRGWGLQPLRSLQELSIQVCPKFLSAYQAPGCPFPSSLQHLTIIDPMEGVQTLDFLSSLSSLTQLSIFDCEEDLRCEGLWPLLTQGQLSKLTVRGTPRFFAGLDPILTGLQQDEQEQQLLPLQYCSSKLQELTTDDFAGILVKPFCRLLSSSLTNLSLGCNNEVERFTKEQEEALQLLTSLQDLRFECCDMLQCLPAGLHKLTSLKRLEIRHCPSIKSLPKGGLPTSLKELVVWNCRNKKLKQHCRKLIGTIPKIKL